MLEVEDRKLQCFKWRIGNCSALSGGQETAVLEVEDRNLQCLKWRIGNCSALSGGQETAVL